MTDRNPVEDALRNSLILNRIFYFLPTKSLLKNATLVNKFWCEESRKFIRDYRKCTARISHECNSSLPFITNLFKFNSQLLGMKTTVPYNGISFTTASPAWCETGAEHAELCGIIRSDDMKMKLKFKDLCIELVGRHCHCCGKHYGSMKKLLQSMSDKLEYLKIIQSDCPSLNLSKSIECSSSLGVFPKLERLETNSQFLGLNEQLLKKIIHSAPNLKKVINGQDEDSWKMISMLSPEKLYLLANLHFEIKSQQDEKFYKEIGDFGPALELFRVIIPRGENLSKFGASFHRIFQKLLESSQRSLKIMEIVGKISEILKLLHLVPSAGLLNLSDLGFSSDATGQQFSYLGGGVDFQRFFPSLKKIQFVSSPANNDDYEDLRIALAAPYTSPTVTRLELELGCIPNAKFSQFAKIFPAVTSLQIRSLSADNMFKLSQITSLWSALEELQLQGETSGLWRNYDSEFCGTTLEEMAYLWEESPEFLNQVHIVPIRPCLSSLANAWT